MTSARSKILVTGGGGFVGRFLIPYLQDRGHDILSVGRGQVGTIDRDTDWTPYLQDVDAIIHLAGRAHVMRETSDNPIDLYRETNLHGTLRLARQAEEAGIRRFVFLSSVKVMGEASDRALNNSDLPAPCDPYGVSKAEAEDALREIKGRMEIVNLRPPLVYGPGVKGNFIAMLKLIDKGLPLPLGLIRNRRSMIYVGNLASAIEHALHCAPGDYLPSDGDDLSTPQLFSMTADALGKRITLLPIPVALLKLLGLLTGKSQVIQRLTGSLILDGALPGWKPPYKVSRGLSETADWFRNTIGGK